MGACASATRLGQVLVALAALTGPARAKHTLRVATIAPDGTGWAREVRALAREVEAATHGELVMKIYFGAIAGDELEVGERIRRGQLDASISGGALCQRVTPSMKVAAIPGLFQSRDEASYVMHRLFPLFDEESRQAGFVNLGTAAVGPQMLFTAAPVRSLDDLRRIKLARWNLDELGILVDREIGLRSIPVAPERAAQALEERAVDGAITTPTAALAWQMFARMHYFLDLRMSFFYGCTVVASRAFDSLSAQEQSALRGAVAKFAARIDDLGQRQDDQLLGGLLQKQGIQALPVTDGLRSEFLVAARAARERLGDKLAPTPVLQRVLALLADYRAEHPVPVN